MNALVDVRIQTELHYTFKVHFLTSSSSNVEIRAPVDVRAYILDEKYGQLHYTFKVHLLTSSTSYVEIRAPVDVRM